MKTPCYVFDIVELERRILSIRNLCNEIELTYSIKANPFLLPYVIDMINHVEVCSPGELEICIKNEIPGEKIIYSGLLKEKEDIHRACEYGVDIITAESYQQFELINSVSESAGKVSDVLLRLSSGNQFGMDEETFIQIIINLNKHSSVNVKGIHFFSGTQKNKKLKYENDIKRLTSLLSRLKDELNYVPEFIEYGLGSGVEYFDNPVEEKDMEVLTMGLDAFNQICNSGRRGIELGRFIASTCGKFRTTVKEVKESNGIKYAIVDGGIHQLNYYGQIKGMKVPPIKQEKNRAERCEYCICGSLCTTEDVLVRSVELHELKQGDVLTFERCGAYSVTEAPVLFLSRTMPEINIKLPSGKLKHVRGARESYDLNC